MLNRRLLASVAMAVPFIVVGSGALAAGPKGMLPGFLNPKTGVFSTPAVPSEGDFDTAAAQIYSGLLSLKFTVTLKSAVPADWPIHCTQSASVVDPSGLYYTDSKTVLAVRNGNTATCNVNINYAWNLTSPAVKVSAIYSVGAMSLSNALSHLETTGTLPQITIPANGGSSVRNVPVTL
ncbi:MAG: hypothetical protein ACOZJX_02880 [Pseudomonadota bacterium]